MSESPASTPRPVAGPDDLRFDPVIASERDLLWRMMQEHLSILARYARIRRHENGDYDYRWFDEYFGAPNRRFPFFIRPAGEPDAEPIGLVLLHQMPPNISPVRRESLALAELFVRTAAQRCGTGAAAVQWAVDQAIRRRMPLHWWVLRRNTPAQRFYEAIVPAIADRAEMQVERCRPRGGDVLWVLVPPARD